MSPDEHNEQRRKNDTREGEQQSESYCPNFEPGASLGGVINQIQRGNHRDDSSGGEPDSHEDADREFPAAGVHCQFFGNVAQNLESRGRKKIREIAQQAALQLGAAGGKQAKQGQQEKQHREKSEEKIESEPGSALQEAIFHALANHISRQAPESQTSQFPE